MIFFLRLDPKSDSTGPGFESDLIFGNQSGFDGYRSAQKAYAFGLKEKIWLEIGDKKVPLGSYQMENSFGMSRGRTFVLVFPPLAPALMKENVEVTLVLDDIVPGLARKRLKWDLPVGKYDESI